MKFFSGLGSCFPVTPVVEEDSNEPRIVTVGDDQYYVGQKCKGPSAATNWRPSLIVISENGGRPFEESGRKTRSVNAHASSERMLSTGEGKPAVNRRSRCKRNKRDDPHQRSDPMEMPIPVYSAAPFMF